MIKKGFRDFAHDLPFGVYYSFFVPWLWMDSAGSVN
jgi:hypothetical protein